MAQSKEFVDASHALNDLSHALALLESENASLRGAADGLCDENAKLREQLEYALQTSRARLETIDRLKAENAKLREEIEAAKHDLQVFSMRSVQLDAENAKLFALLKHESEQTEKLRELVSDMWRFTGAACKKYPRLFDPSAQGGQMVQLNAIDAFELRMRELGIEADI